MRTKTIRTSTDVRLSEVNRIEGSWLLANFPDAIEAAQAAAQALDPDHPYYQRLARYAFLITTTVITKPE